MNLPKQAAPVARQVTASQLTNKGVAASDCGCSIACVGACVMGRCLGYCI
jgi:hypothetical protein